MNLGGGSTGQPHLTAQMLDESVTPQADRTGTNPTSLTPGTVLFPWHSDVL